MVVHNSAHPVKHKLNIQSQQQTTFQVHQSQHVEVWWVKFTCIPTTGKRTETRCYHNQLCPTDRGNLNTQCDLVWFLPTSISVSILLCVVYCSLQQAGPAEIVMVWVFTGYLTGKWQGYGESKRRQVDVRHKQLSVHFQGQTRRQIDFDKYMHSTLFFYLSKYWEVRSKPIDTLGPTHPSSFM